MDDDSRPDSEATGVANAGMRPQLLDARSAARFDFDKLEHLNAHYLREADSRRLVNLVADRCGTITDVARKRLQAGMEGLKPRARTIKELAELAGFYVAERPLSYNDKALKLLGAEGAAELLEDLHRHLTALSNWDEGAIEAEVRAVAEEAALKLGAVAQPLRAALAGSNVSPGIFEVAAVLGREETLGRIVDAVSRVKQAGSPAD